MSSYKSLLLIFDKFLWVTNRVNFRKLLELKSYENLSTGYGYFMKTIIVSVRFLWGKKQRKLNKSKLNKSKSY